MNGRRVAVVISVERHDDPVLRRFSVPSADVSAFAEVLADPALGGFEAVHLRDPGLREVYGPVKSLFEGRDQEDCVLLYFRGVMLTGPGGGLYLAAADTVMGRPADTAIDVAQIAALLQRSRAGQAVILLDGRTGGPVDVGHHFRAARSAEWQSRVVIAAVPRLEPPTFAGMIAEGVAGGAADRDRDGWIGVSELYEHLRERDPSVRQWVFGSGRQPWLARVRRPGSDQLALIAQLAGAAVGSDLSRAVEARETLRRLATGEGRVAAAATAALRRTSVRLAESSLDFGTVPPGTHRLTADIAVQGPPLAAASVVSTDTEGLHARLEGDLLRVSWVPVVGRLEGAVTLDGPAGAARLAVTGEVSTAAGTGGNGVPSSPAAPTTGSPAGVPEGSAAGGVVGWGAGWALPGSDAAWPGGNHGGAWPRSTGNRSSGQPPEPPLTAGDPVSGAFSGTAGAPPPPGPATRPPATVPPVTVPPDAGSPDAGSPATVPADVGPPTPVMSRGVSPWAPISGPPATAGGAQSSAVDRPEPVSSTGPGSTAPGQSSPSRSSGTPGRPAGTSEATGPAPSTDGTGTPDGIHPHGVPAAPDSDTLPAAAEPSDAATPPDDGAPITEPVATVEEHTAATSVPDEAAVREATVREGAVRQVDEPATRPSDEVVAPPTDEAAVRAAIGPGDRPAGGTATDGTAGPLAVAPFEVPGNGPAVPAPRQPSEDSTRWWGQPVHAGSVPGEQQNPSASRWGDQPDEATSQWGDQPDEATSQWEAVPAAGAGSSDGPPGPVAPTSGWPTSPASPWPGTDAWNAAAPAGGFGASSGHPGSGHPGTVYPGTGRPVSGPPTGAAGTGFAGTGFAGAWSGSVPAGSVPAGTRPGTTGRAAGRPPRTDYPAGYQGTFTDRPGGGPNSASSGTGQPTGGPPYRPEEKPRRRGALIAVGVIVLALVVGGSYAGVRLRLSGDRTEAAPQQTGVPEATQTGAPVEAPTEAPTETLPGGTSSVPATDPAGTEAPAPPSLARPVVVDRIAVGREPEGVTVSPDSRTLYVADQNSKDVHVVDVESKKIDVVKVPNTPRFLTLSADGSRLYVTLFENDFTGNGLAVIDTASKSLVKTVRTGPRPFEPAVAPDGTVWVPIHNGARVEIYDPKTLTEAARISVPPNPHWIVFTPDGRTAFTANHESSQISVVDVADRIVRKNFKVGRSPHALAVTPDGTRLVVTNYDLDTVEVYDTANQRLVHRIEVGREPQAVMISADGRHAYIVNEGSDSLSVIALGDGKVVSTVPVGDSPRVNAIAPDGRRLYVTDGRGKTITVLRTTEE